MKDNCYKYDYNGKIIDIIRDKNINLYGLHLYFSTIERLVWKYIF
jgi:hypothetical protein